MRTLAASEADRASLRREFFAEEGTFLAKALAAEWDPEALGRLARVMRRVCVATEGDEHLVRWMADGFYAMEAQLDRYLPPRLGLSDAFVSDLKEHMMYLTSWFFSGECAFQDPESLEEELQALLARDATV